MSLFCQSTNPNCDGDQAVTLLSSIFGHDFINAFINASGPASTVPASGLLTNILLGGVASVAMSLVLVFALGIGLTALLKSAQDGEAFGKDSKVTTIVSRILYSIILLLPTASGYCFIQVVVLGMVLWSNNVSNTINNRTLGESLMASASLSDTHDRQRDIFGFRKNAPVMLRQLHCINVLNQEFYGLAPGFGRYFSDGSYPANANLGVAMTAAEKRSNYIDKTSKTANNWTSVTYNFAYADNRLEIGNKHEPICGGASLNVVNPAAVNSELMNIPVYKLRQEDQNKINVALASVQAKLQQEKNNLYRQFFIDMEKWYIAYAVNANATENEGVFPISKAGMDAFNLLVEDYVNKSHAKTNGILTSENGYTAVQTVVNSLNKRGWMMTPESRIKVGQYRAVVEKYVTEPLWSFTAPTLNSSIMSNSKGEAIYNSVYVAMDNAVGSITSKDTWVANGDIGNTTNLLSMSSDGGDSNKVANMDQKFSAYGSAWATNLSKSLALGILVGDTGDSELLNKNSNTITASTLHRNTNVIKNIQDTGEMILSAKAVAQSVVVGLKLAVLAARSGSTVVQWVPGLASVTKEGTDALQYAVENIFAPVLSQLITYLTILGIWMAVVIPYMPMIFFGLACVGWIIHILYAVCGLPLWALMHMIPERTFVGSQTQGYVTVLTLFMRPIFIIVGFWMAEIIVGPALVTLTDMFFSYQGAMSIAYSSNSFAVIFTELITFIWKFIAYLFLMTSAIYLIYGLVFSVADQVQQWIGSGLNGGQWGETNSKEAIQKFGGTASSLAGPAPTSRRPPPPGRNKTNPPNNGGGGGGGGNPQTHPGGGGSLANNGGTTSFSPPMNMPARSSSFGSPGGLNNSIAPSGKAGPTVNSGSSTSTPTSTSNTTFGLGTSGGGKGTSTGGLGGAYSAGNYGKVSSTFNKPAAGATGKMSFGSVGISSGSGYTTNNGSKPSSRFGSSSTSPSGRSSVMNRARSGLSSTLSKFKRKGK
ncbi:DotA/TraY family protein [Acinetobacter sp. YH01009]|uniref:DotA/TraY family protein n=1 Tax=Acinetobacter sp. YH01009 TaxID=2601025 RepID=UPI0015D32483|nr:DotA/TraY family protein [Acinetobacter sp. YH01009]